MSCCRQYLPKKICNAMTKEKIKTILPKAIAGYRKTSAWISRKLHLTPKRRNYLITTLWSLTGVFIFVSVLVFITIGKGMIGYVPPIEQLENPIDRYATQVISSDGKMLGSYSYGKDNRIYVSYNDLSPELVKALIATEDVRFTKHCGIDVRGLFRAVVKRGLLMQKSGGGGGQDPC